MSSKCRYTEVAATPTSRATARSVSGGAAGSASSALAASMMSSRSRSPWPRGFRCRVLVICFAGIATSSSYLRLHPLRYR